MRLTVKELIARAYEVARVLKDADAALLREVATRLDVMYVALSEAMERSRELESEKANLISFINTECFVKDGAEYDYASTRLPLTPTREKRIEDMEREKAALESIALALRDDMREARTLTVKLPKPRRVKLESGESVHGWTAYEMTSAITNAGIKLQIEE